MTKEKKHNSKKNTENKKRTINNLKNDVTETKKIDKKEKIKKSKIAKNDSEIVKLIKIVLIITIIMVIFYLITMVVTKNQSLSTYENDGSSEKAVIQYEEIMIGTLLKKNEDKYYVLIKEEDDQRLVEYDNLIQLATAKEDTPRFYTANLTDSFNKGYLAKEANITNDMDEFKVSGTTLIKVKNEKIENSYSNYDEIKKELKKLSD